MKKATLLIIAVVLAAIMAQAQNNTLEILGHTFSMVFNYDGNTYNAPIFKTCKMVEKPNGDLLLDNYFRRRVSPNASTMVSIGDGFYTVSRQGLVVTDSTFLEPIYGFEEDHSAVCPFQKEGESHYLRNRFGTFLSPCRLSNQYLYHNHYDWDL